MAQAEDRVQKPPQEGGALEARRLSDEKLAQIMAFSPYAICMTDLQGTILECNPSGHSLHGFEPGELIGKPCLDLVAPDDREKALQGIKQTLDQGMVHHVELTLMTKDGRTFPADLSAQVIHDAQGRPTNFVTIIHDITERREFEQRLLDYQQRLRSLASELSLSEERQRRQIASLLHDGACQHLALLKMQLQGLCNEMEPANRKPFEAICDGLTTTMEALRNMTLDLSPPTLYVAGLEAAIESFLEEQIQAKHGLRYTLEVDPEAVPKADDLRVLIFQSIRELLINVIKHAKATHVRVTIKRRGSKGQVIVADNGRGFDVRAVEVSISKSGGFGLFSIRERLEFIGGQLHIQSKKGRGSRLTLIVPLDGRPGVPAKA